MNDDTRIVLDDDELITLNKAREILGGVSISTCYEDAQLMGLKIKMTAGERRTKMVRFIKREVLALRAERVSRSEASAAKVRAAVEARVEQRRARQRVPLRLPRKAKAKAEGLSR